MKKKSLVLFAGVAAAAAVALASCGEEPAKSTEKYEEGSRLDVCVSYNGKYGYVDAHENFTNPITNATYQDGDLLPVWKKYADVLNVNIQNAFKHASSASKDNYKTDVTNQFKSNIDATQYIDLYHNSTDNILAMGAEGNAVDLMPYVEGGYMPNFAKFLKDYPAIAQQMKQGNKIYFTPYFDGYNTIKRMIQMDGSVVKRLLDGTPNFDTTAAGITAKFQPFVGTADANYAADTKVKVSVNGEAKEITVKKTTNIVAEQNKLLTAGTTGKALGDQFVAYIKAAYKDAFDKGYVKTVSDVFLSEAACYNTDDLVALMRVFKANPALVSEGNCTSVVPLIVREQKTGRVDALYRWMGEVFGIQGLGAETGANFYAADGKMYDAQTTKATYEGLDLMAQLYEEGLIQQNFWVKSSSVTSTYAKAWFGRSVKDNVGYALMEHDYTATQSAFNKLDDTKIGTDVKNVQAGCTPCELQPILAPLTYWATASYNHDDALTSRNGKTLTRYYEENRTLKTESWCIPTNSDNKLAAVALMDYVLSPEGQVYTDFGPEEYWAKDASGAYAKVTFNGQTTVQLNDATLAWYAADGKDYWTFCRDKIGASDAIGYVRTATIDYQVTNGVARGGAMNLSNAVKAGVQVTDLNQSKYKFGECAPVVGLPKVTTDNAKSYAAITAFWGEAFDTTAKGWAKYMSDASRATVVLGKDSEDAEYTFTTVKNQFAAKDTNYLLYVTQAMNDNWGLNVVPAYLAKK